MENYINIFGLVNDGSVWLAIIAINMTIIGLTSLAESKSVIGVDYGKYLIKSYKIIGSLRIYHLLVVFALVNITSLFSMFIEIYAIRVINFSVLVLSLVFAIYYFFAYILIENPRVKNQIHLSELSGIYYKSNDKTTFDADLLTNIKDGWRTKKRLSTNVITYFDNFNSESQSAFDEIFGPESLIYSQKRSVNRYWKKNYRLRQFDYTSDLGGVHISHEFFQLYRYSELQEKWLLEILALFNKSYTMDKQSCRLDNILRVIAHVNRFGVCENLFKYKFLEYLAPFIYEALNIDVSRSVCETKEVRTEKEEYMLQQLFRYMLNTIDNYHDSIFFKTALDVCCRLIHDKNMSRNVHAIDKLKLLAAEYDDDHGPIVKRFISEVVFNYLEQKNDQDFDVEEIANILKSKSPNEDSIIELQDKLFVG